MLSPSHQRSFVAQREFTDREKPLKLFFDALETLQPFNHTQHGLDVYRVLTFYGVGGQGKSALYRHFCKQLATRQEEQFNPRAENPQLLAFANFSFEDEQGRYLNPVEALLKIRLDLKQHGARFPHFDVAFMRYFALSQPGADIRSMKAELFRGESELVNDIVGIAGDALSEIPGWDFLHKHADRLRIRGQEWWERRRLGLLAQLDDKDQGQLLTALPQYLGADLLLAQERNPNLRLVVLMDTYERLWHDTSQRGMNYLIDDWVRKLVQDSPGVLFTFFGRDKIAWAEEESAWETVLDQHLLGGLSDDDANLFLEKAGVEEDDVRAVMIESSKGGDEGEKPACLPFYLDIQLEQYENERNAQGVISTSNYGGSKKRILDRFLNAPYTDRHAKRTLDVMAQPRFLSKVVYDRLAEAFLDATALSFDELLSYSFVQVQDEQVVLHALMREHLRESLKENDEKRFLKVHSLLFEYYDDQAQPEAINAVTTEHDHALQEALFHKEMSSPEAVSEWFSKHHKIFYDAGRYLLLLPLLQQVRNISRQWLGEEHPHTLTSMNNLAQSLFRLGDYQAAKSLHEKTLEISQRVLGKEHPDTLTSMNNLALSLSNLGDYQAAKSLHDKTLEIRQRVLGKEHPDTLLNMGNLAQSLFRLGDYQAAKSLHEKTLEISQRVLGKEHPATISSMSNLASDLFSLGDYQAAKSLNENTLEIYQRVLGEEHPDTLASMSNLARNLRELGYIDKVLTDYPKIITLSKKVSGEKHANTLRYRYHYAVTLKQAKRAKEARDIVSEIYPLAIGSLGEDHLWTKEIKKLLDELG